MCTPSCSHSQVPALPCLLVQDWQVPLGRRFRALKLWFVVRTYGAEGLRTWLRHNLKLAAAFATHVASDTRFEIAAPPRFGLVCFRFKVCSPCHVGIV